MCLQTQRLAAELQLVQPYARHWRRVVHARTARSAACITGPTWPVTAQEPALPQIGCTLPMNRPAASTATRVLQQTHSTGSHASMGERHAPSSWMHHGRQAQCRQEADGVLAEAAGLQLAPLPCLPAYRPSAALHHIASPACVRAVATHTAAAGSSTSCHDVAAVTHTMLSCVSPLVTAGSSSVPLQARAEELGSAVGGGTCRVGAVGLAPPQLPAVPPRKERAAPRLPAFLMMMNAS
jgi:hypothetical protein